MNNTANKKDIFYIIVLILTFITVVVGATFAIYTFVGSPKNDTDTSAVYTGTFSISYLSGDKIKFHYLSPREKPTIDTVENVYKNKFKVTNTGSIDGEIEKIVIEIAKDEFEETRLNPDINDKGTIVILKYSLYNKDAEEIISGNIGGNGIVSEVTIASNLELKNNETEEYTLLIWLEDDGNEQKGYMDKNFIGTIRVDATQKKG